MFWKSQEERKRIDVLLMQALYLGDLIDSCIYKPKDLKSRDIAREELKKWDKRK